MFVTLNKNRFNKLKYKLLFIALHNMNSFFGFLNKLNFLMVDFFSIKRKIG